MIVAERRSDCLGVTAAAARRVLQAGEARARGLGASSFDLSLEALGSKNVCKADEESGVAFPRNNRKASKKFGERGGGLMTQCRVRNSDGSTVFPEEQLILQLSRQRRPASRAKEKCKASVRTFLWIASGRASYSSLVMEAGCAC